MRYRKPKHAQRKKGSTTFGDLLLPQQRKASSAVHVEQVLLTHEEARVLKFIRRDVVLAVITVALVIAGFSFADMTVAKQDTWDDLAQSVARSAGLLK